MSRFVPIMFAALCACATSHAQWKLNLQNSWGINAINLEDATGTPEFDDSLPVHTRQLTDWSRFYYNIELQVLKPVNKNLDVGLGVGFNRLYYWEERFRNLFDTEFQFDFGTIWTTEFSGIVNFNFDNWLIHTSAGLHSFNVGTSTVGLAVGGGRNISISDRLTIPVMLKTDFVFGDGTTIAPNLSMGIMLSL